jgi:hypothetical protein
VNEAAALAAWHAALADVRVIRFEWDENLALPPVVEWIEATDGERRYKALLHPFGDRFEVYATDRDDVTFFLRSVRTRLDGRLPRSPREVVDRLRHADGGFVSGDFGVR